MRPVHSRTFGQFSFVAWKITYTCSRANLPAISLVLFPSVPIFLGYRLRHTRGSVKISVNMSYYEAQSWQIPVQQASLEQTPPPSRSGRHTDETISVWTEAHTHTGTNSALQHEDGVAFDLQIEGMSSSRRPFSFCKALLVWLCRSKIEEMSPKHSSGLDFARDLY